jgi:pilus assembly protein CpaE
MDTLVTVADPPAPADALSIDTALPTSAPAPTAMAYLLDADSEGVVSACFADLGFIDRDVMHGSIDTAIDELPRRSWPRFLIVDISGIDDPLLHINRLAEVCNLETEVIVVGERNDIVLYRALKAAGVAEYFYKPLVANLLSRALDEIATGSKNLQPSRSGMLVFVVGVRGGVGVTTIATSLAWYFAEIRQRGVLLLDLDLHSGDAALQLDAQPSHALREALGDTKRIDELFLERGVAPVTERLGLLAGVEPLSDRVVLDEDAVMQLLHKILAHYRYVLVDLPGEIALSFPKLLHMPSTLLLVSDGSIASIREVARWRDFIGPNTPERRLLHVLNKKNVVGALPQEEMLRVIPPPDIAIDWDRQIIAAAALGTKTVQQCGAIRDGMAALSLRLSGVGDEPARSLWKRVFG